MLRSFAKAETFTYIDATKMDESKKWLIQKQKENGCFQQSGKLFNNRMKVTGPAALRLRPGRGRDPRPERCSLPRAVFPMK